MSFLDLFSDNARLYASARPGYPDELFSFIASQAPAREKAWDCGTGNGQAAISLARYFDSIFASDASEAQIAQAIPNDRVIYTVQRAEATDYPDRFFDAVCVAQALHWFDPDVFFKELRRVAKPGAVFAAWGYDWFSVSPEFDRVFKTAILDIIEPYWPPQNRLLWRGYADISLPFPRIEIPNFRMKVHWNMYQLLAYVHTWSATRHGISTISSNFFQTAEHKLTAHWGTPQTVREVSMRLHFIAGRID